MHTVCGFICPKMAIFKYIRFSKGWKNRGCHGTVTTATSALPWLENTVIIQGWITFAVTSWWLFIELLKPNTSLLLVGHCFLDPMSVCCATSQTSGVTLGQRHCGAPWGHPTSKASQEDSMGSFPLTANVLEKIHFCCKSAWLCWNYIKLNPQPIWAIIWLYELYQDSIFFTIRPEYFPFLYLAADRRLSHSKVYLSFVPV